MAKDIVGSEALILLLCSRLLQEALGLGIGFNDCSLWSGTLPRSIEIGFIPLYGSLIRSHLEHGTPACSPGLVADINHLDRIHSLATSLVSGFCHLPYKERHWDGPSFLSAAATSG